MTMRFKIATAALGLFLATGAASAQTGAVATAPNKASTVEATTIAHKSHRVHVAHRTVKHAKEAHRSLHSKIVREAGLKHVAKARLAATQKHALNTKTSVVR